MCVCACVFVSMHVLVYVCMFVCTGVCMYASLCIRMGVYACVCVYLCACAYLCVCVYLPPECWSMVWTASVSGCNSCGPGRSSVPWPQAAVRLSAVPWVRWRAAQLSKLLGLWVRRKLGLVPRPEGSPWEAALGFDLCHRFSLVRILPLGQSLPVEFWKACAAPER